MPSDLFREMKEFLGFDESDAKALAMLQATIRPRLPSIVEVFYGTLIRDPNARSVLEGDEGRIERLKGTLLVWLGELFEGRYDDDYFQRRCRIGRMHVRISLPQHLMFTSMSLIRRELAAAIEQINPPDRVARQAALNKLLDLELAVMNETYREDSMSRLQAAEQARYQAKLSESEHLAAVGALAASLAHEIKNPLAGISGAIQIFGDELADDHPHKEIIAESLRQIDRLDAAVKDLLIYARPKPPAIAPVAIVPLVQRTLVLLREEPAFRGVRVDCEPEDGKWLLRVDEHLIQQVLTNLLINAAHACQHDGTIRCLVEPLKAGIQVVIEDDGLGMSGEVLERAFEPFFTTKARGTGLGLAICKRIVESHNGTITLRSRRGRGTRVTLQLPDQP